MTILISYPPVEDANNIVKETGGDFGKAFEALLKQVPPAK